LVLDEPLASVDVARRGEVLPYLERLRDRYRIPMVYISHDYEEVLRLAAWVVVMDQGRVLAADTPSALSLLPSLQHRIRADAVGAVIESIVAGRDEANHLMTLDLGGQTLRLADAAFEVGTRVRLQIPANEVILATELPTGLSVRNSLAGSIVQISREPDGLILVTVQVGDQRVLSRVTPAAVSDLALEAGRPVWALVKAASLTGSLYRGVAPSA
jgi:molybdate transport system ATP-binding protein